VFLVFFFFSLKKTGGESNSTRFCSIVIVDTLPSTNLGPFRLARKSEFVNAEFVYLFPTRGLINWFLKLALTTAFTSSLYFLLEVRVKGVPQNPEFANLFETEIITDVISNTKVFDGYIFSQSPFRLSFSGK
jgi:hypothetical protein